MLVLAGGADTVDHLSSSEGRGGLHEETLAAATDSFDSVFENVDNPFEPHLNRHYRICSQATVIRRAAVASADHSPRSLLDHRVVSVR
jgi:hypothetical protein